MLRSCFMEHLDDLNLVSLWFCDSKIDALWRGKQKHPWKNFTLEFKIHAETKKYLRNSLLFQQACENICKPKKNHIFHILRSVPTYFAKYSQPCHHSQHVAALRISACHACFANLPNKGRLTDWLTHQLATDYLI